MKLDIALLVELIAATLLKTSAVQDALTVVIHQSHRSLPLLESAGTTAYVNLRPILHQDFCPVIGGFPTFKERVSAVSQPETAARLLQRAGVVLVCVPDDAQALAALPEFELAGQLYLIYGSVRAAGWSRLIARLRGGEFIPVEIAGARLLISRPILDYIGYRQSLLPAGLGELIRRLALQMPSLLNTEEHDGGLRLRIRLDPLRLIVVGTPSLAYHVMQENRALFNPRGVGAFVLPSEGCGRLQILVRNVRDRIDDLTIAVADDAITMERIDYTEFGAVLSLPPIQVDSGRDALMFLSLPHGAVPQDGFCDIGAITHTLELA